MNKNPAIGQNLNEVLDEMYSPDELALAKLEAKVISKIIIARQTKGLTQKELATRCGVTQAMISRIESGNANARLDTLIRVLLALGQTLDIVPCLDTTVEKPAKKRVRRTVQCTETVV